MNAVNTSIIQNSKSSIQNQIFKKLLFVQKLLDSLFVGFAAIVVEGRMASAGHGIPGFIGGG